MIKRICINIEDCEIEDRRRILNMVAQKIGTEHLYEEGMGVRFSFRIIDDDLLEEMDKFIIIAKRKTKLNTDSDSETETKHS